LRKTGSLLCPTAPPSGWSNCALGQSPRASPARCRSRRRAASCSHMLSGTRPLRRLDGAAETAVSQVGAVSRNSTMGLNKIDGILDCHDLFRRIIRDLAPELLLERHHQLNRIQAVGAQIVNKTGVFGHL